MLVVLVLEVVPVLVVLVLVVLGTLTPTSISKCGVVLVVLDGQAMLLSSQHATSHKGGQFVPPFASCWVIARDLIFDPPPQVAEHLLQGAHSPTSQLSTQSWLHSLDSKSEPHGSPLPQGVTSTRRVLFWVP